MSETCQAVAMEGPCEDAATQVFTANNVDWLLCDACAASLDATLVLVDHLRSKGGRL